MYHRYYKMNVIILLLTFLHMQQLLYAGPAWSKEARNQTNIAELNLDNHNSIEANTQQNSSKIYSEIATQTMLEQIHKKIDVDIATIIDEDQNMSFIKPDPILIPREMSKLILRIDNARKRYDAL